MYVGIEHVERLTPTMTGSEFIKNPTTLLRQILGIGRNDDFAAGRLAMALEIVSVIRILEDNPMLSAQASGTVISVLETFLRDQHLDWCYGTYDKLSASRRPTFVTKPVSPETTPARLYKLRSLSVVRQSQHDVPTSEQLELTFEEDEETPNA